MQSQRPFGRGPPEKEQSESFVGFRVTQTVALIVMRPLGICAYLEFIILAPSRREVVTSIPHGMLLSSTRHMMRVLFSQSIQSMAPFFLVDIVHSYDEDSPVPFYYFLVRRYTSIFLSLFSPEWG